MDVPCPAQAEVQILKLKNKATAYTCGNANPLFFDPDGRGDLLVPTVYALCKCPQIIETLYTYSEVSPKVRPVYLLSSPEYYHALFLTTSQGMQCSVPDECMHCSLGIELVCHVQVLGGADLFLQGLIVPDGGLGDFSAGDLRAVSVPGNPYPFAVGTMEVGSGEIAKTGLKGKGLKLLHFFGDQLWGLGDKSSPDSSFTLTRIFPVMVNFGICGLAAFCSKSVLMPSYLLVFIIHIHHDLCSMYT